MPFPLPIVPHYSYKTGGRAFGAHRTPTRKHAGCDLIVPKGTPIFAMADGVVAEWDRNKVFYRGTYAIAVQHLGYVARYCEIMDVVPGIGRGTIVKAGQPIAFVGKMFRDSMLHLEIYGGPYGKGRLSVPENKPFNRREDLQNPTPLLDRLVSDLPTFEY
jgi:murein DD-endopeptidase MepM/ murein hydrolase activator NlpD